MSFFIVEMEDGDSGVSQHRGAGDFGQCLNSERTEETLNKSGGGSAFYPSWSKTDMPVTQAKEVSGTLG